MFKPISNVMSSDSQVRSVFTQQSGVRAVFTAAAQRDIGEHCRLHKPKQTETVSNNLHLLQLFRTL